MPATTTPVSILDLATPVHTVEIQGANLRIVKLGPSKMVPLLKRFPEMRQIEKLQFAADDTIALDDIDDEKLEKLDKLVAFNNAMTAAALGHLNEPEIEAMVDEKFTDEEKILIITAAQELATAAPAEGFSKRSA
jgi:hypothetical protein